MVQAAKCILAIGLYLGGVAGGQTAPSAKAAPAAKTDVPAEFREMQQVEDRWDDAVAKRDQYALELVLAPQFIGISASGDVTTRNQQIAHMFQKDAEPLSLDQKVISVRYVGEVAIVNGTYVMTWQGGKATILEKEKGIFSHVFAHVRGTWLCLNAQRTVVSEEVKGPGQRARTKHSDAELPLHLPMVYKGPDGQPAPAAGATP